tara:strand:+ start:675 stop:1244 length:570 start_codon:yes stop_codon:yes gene_type:complete
MKKELKKTINSLTVIGMMSISNPVYSAETLIFQNGVFNRSVPLYELEYLSNKRKAKGSLSKLIRYSKQNPEELSLLLNQKYELPLVITSKLMYSNIGEVIIKRVAKILYPQKLSNSPISIYAIRSSVIQGINEGNGTINLISFLKYYPNKNLTVDLPALFKILNKVESMSDLVQFFSNSPLETLKDQKP